MVSYLRKALIEAKLFLFYIQHRILLETHEVKSKEYQTELISHHQSAQPMMTRMVKKKINDNMASSLSISMTQENTTHLQIGRGMGLVQEGGGGVVEFATLFIL